MKLLLPASEVPEGATVTKPTGEVEYRLSCRITIHTDDGKWHVIKSDGVRYMSPVNSGSSDINAIAGSKIVAWVVEEDELLRWLIDRDEERNSQ